MKIRSIIRIFVVLQILFVPWAVSAQKAETETVRLDDEKKIDWYDVQRLGVEGRGWNNTESYYDRLPVGAKEIVTKPVWNLSHCTAGMVVRFKTNAEEIKVRWALTKKELDMPHMPATGVSGIDLYFRDKKGDLKYCANGRPQDSINIASFKLPDSNEYLLYLPLYNGIKKLEIGTPAGVTLSALKPLARSKEVVFYGTSITQGACASRPGMAASSIVGRELNIPVINLGFSGSGKMEIEMAEMLSQLDPAVYVLDCLWNMSPEMVSERFEPFVRKLRSSRQTTPILLVEDSNFKNESTLKGNIIRDILFSLKKQGIENLYFLSNKDMLGEDWDGTVDGIHPNDLGNFRQALLFTKSLREILEK